MEDKTKPNEMDMKFLAMLYASDLPINLASTKAVLVEGGPEVDLMSIHGPLHAIVKITMLVMKEAGRGLNVPMIRTTGNHFENSELVVDGDDPKMAFLTFLNCPLASEEEVAAIAMREYAHNGDFMNDLVTQIMGVDVVKINLDDLKDPEGEFQKFMRNMDEAIKKAEAAGTESAVAGPEVEDDSSGTQDNA